MATPVHSNLTVWTLCSVFPTALFEGWFNSQCSTSASVAVPLESLLLEAFEQNAVWHQKALNSRVGLMSWDKRSISICLERLSILRESIKLFKHVQPFQSLFQNSSMILLLNEEAEMGQAIS